MLAVSSVLGLLTCLHHGTWNHSVAVAAAVSEVGLITAAVSLTSTAIIRDSSTESGGMGNWLGSGKFFKVWLALKSPGGDGTAGRGGGGGDRGRATTATSGRGTRATGGCIATTAAVPLLYCTAASAALAALLSLCSSFLAACLACAASGRGLRFFKRFPHTKIATKSPPPFPGAASSGWRN